MSIEVITGCMFSGKTEELMRRVKRAKIAKQTVDIFTPDLERCRTKSIEDRIEVATHHPELIYSLSRQYDVVAIDEGQLFSNDLIDTVLKIGRERRVIVAGLDTTFDGQPFGPMPDLMALSTKLDKLTAICVICGKEATRNPRTVSDTVPILIGDKEYEARCFDCFYAHSK